MQSKWNDTDIRRKQGPAQAVDGPKPGGVESGGGEGQSEDRSPTGGKYGFYLQTYHNRKSVLEVVKGIRSLYPGACIFMVGDGGYDFSPLAKRFNAHYEKAKGKANIQGAMPTEQSKRWLERLARASTFCKCEFLINMETDSPIRRRILVDPPFDAGGVDSLRLSGGGQAWTQRLVDEGGAGKWSYSSYGLAGGSYIRTSALLGAMAKPDVWDAMETMRTQDDRIYVWSDATLAALLMHYGYIVKPWDDCQQQAGSSEDSNYLQDHNLTDPAFFHDDKKWIGEEVAEHDGTVTTEDATLKPTD